MNKITVEKRYIPRSGNNYSADRLRDLRKMETPELSPAEMAHTAGVDLNLWFEYERGVFPPDEVFSSLASAGFDIEYVLTGLHTDAISLTPDEVKLIEEYRRMDCDARDAFVLLSGYCATASDVLEHPRTPTKIKKAAMALQVFKGTVGNVIHHNSGSITQSFGK